MRKKKGLLPYTVGIEMTAIEKDFDDRERSSALCYVVDAVSRDLRKQKVPRHDCASDGHCVEVSSPRLYTWREVRVFYKKVSAIFRKNKCRPKHPDVVCGGGHIHVGITNKRLIAAVFRDLAMRPYLPWVFTEPDDTDSANSFARHTRNAKQYMRDARNLNFASFDNLWFIGEWLGWLMYSPMYSWNFLVQVVQGVYVRNCMFIDSKDFLIRYSSFRTLEFRFFEAPNSYSEQKDQLMFVFKYLNWIKKRLVNRDPFLVDLPTRQEINTYKQEDAIINFRKLLGAIGLKYSRYEKYVRRNLLPRWELNRKRT